MGLLTRNAKMKKAGITTWNWTLPAYRSRDGFVTCPSAGVCGTTGGCYALQGAYRWTPVSDKHHRNLELARDTERFIDEMSRELSRKRGRIAVRIHDSGDFFNAEYVRAWLEIIQRFPQVVFYAYTKQVILFEGLRRAMALPANLEIIYSEGGILDKHIPVGARHSRVFDTIESLLAAGYDDATEDDSVAWRSESGKIGLVYHGSGSRKWTTDPGDSDTNPSVSGD